jgi:hypothetical protein
MDSKMSFFQKLNSIQHLTDRLDLLDSNPSSDLTAGEDAYTYIDAIVLVCDYSHDKLDKHYKQFMVGVERQFSEDELQFIVNSRLSKLTNPLAIGFYADVVCNAQPKPNSKFVDYVIPNYCKVLQNGIDLKYSDSGTFVKSIAYNVKKYRKDSETSKEVIEQYLAAEDFITAVFNILTNCYNYGFFTSNEIIQIVKRHHFDQQLSDNYFSNKEYFKMLTNINKEAKLSQSELYHKLAENEDTIIQMHPNHIFTTKNLLDKYRYLSSGGFEQEAAECYKQFIYVKTHGTGFERVSASISMPNELFQPAIDMIVMSESPIMTIATDDSLLPSDNAMPFDIFEDRNRLGITMDVYDNNGNPHNKEEYDQKRETDDAFQIGYAVSFIAPMMRSLRPLIEKGSFTAEEILDYLSQTWLGKERMPVTTILKKSPETWLDIIRPSLTLLVNEITKEITSKDGYKGDYVCAIDSLTMKVEGCIRDACRHLGIPTIQASNNEELLDKLLKKLSEARTETSDQVISKPAHRMLCCILGKPGMDLRNSIAHGFTCCADYNLQMALCVLHCLLKVSTIKVK